MCSSFLGFATFASPLLAAPPQRRLPTPASLLQAFVLPDIIFLPTGATVYALNEPVPQSKPRLVVDAATVAQARGPSVKGQPQSPTTARTGHRRSKDCGSSPSAAAAAAAAKPPATPLRERGPGGGALPLPPEGVGSPPALLLPWQLPDMPWQQQLPAATLGPLPAGMPLLPTSLAEAAASVQQMLQLQLGQAAASQPWLGPLQLPLTPLQPPPLPLGLLPVGLQPGLLLPPMPAPTSSAPAQAAPAQAAPAAAQLTPVQPPSSEQQQQQQQVAEERVEQQQQEEQQEQQQAQQWEPAPLGPAASAQQQDGAAPPPE